MIELATRSRRRAERARRVVLRGASGLLMVTALTFVLPAAFGFSSHTVTDDAMSGTMGEGSAVIVDSVPVADLDVGDIITYPGPASPGALVTRRIAEIEPGVLRTSGDRTGALDPWTVTLTESTQDRAVAYVPYAGYVVDALGGSARSWFAGLLVVVMAAVALAGVVAARRDRPRAAGAGGLDAELTSDPAAAQLPPAPRRGGSMRRRSHV